MKILIDFIKLKSSYTDSWFNSDRNNIFLLSFLITVLGTAVYGSTIGLWRGALQALYVSIKFPVLIIITTFFNSLMNWFISLMIGANFSFIRTLKYQFISFAIASIILLSLTPISLFFLYNAPSLSGEALMGNSIITLLHVLLIAIAGIIANLKLYSLLQSHLNNKTLARNVLIAWLVGNMILGCQMSWVLRPFIGSPNLEIQFLRSKPLEGNFYIDVYNKLKTITSYKGAREYE